MQEIIYKELSKIKEIIENGNINILTVWIKNFELFLIQNKNNFYIYLNSLQNKEELTFSKEIFKDYYEKWLSIYQWKFDDIYLYQAEDIAEIYENINYLLSLIKQFKNNNNYNIFFEILFELYNHILLIHINNLKNTLWKK